MSRRFPRRDFLKAATAGLAAGLPLALGAQGSTLAQARRLFTMDLACGAIGVQAPLPEAIALAQQFGFEAVDADAGFLAKQNDDQIKAIRDDLKTRGLVW